MTPLQQAQAVLEALETLIVDPSIDFGPAFGMAQVRQNEAIEIMRAIVRQVAAKGSR